LPNGGISWGPGIGEIVDGVWTRVTRELTNIPTTRAEKIDKIDDTISSRADGAEYTPSRASKIDNLDVTVSSRATTSNVWTYGTRELTNIPTSRAEKIDNLDALISSRANGADYTATRAANLDYLDASVNSRATTYGVWGYGSRKLTYATYPIYTKASSALKCSADTERSESGTDMVKVKEILIFNTGTYRVTFEIHKDPNATTAVAQIYRNGIEYGDRYDSTNNNYETVTQDLVFNRGDLAQLYIRTSEAGKPAYTRSFRLYFDYREEIEPTPIVLLN